MQNQMTTIKLNRFTSYLQQSTYLTQSPTPSPNDYITLILFYINQWLSSFLPAPETRGRFLNGPAQWLSTHYIVAGALLVLILWCCLPPILRCITWVFVTIFNIVKGFFTSVFGCLCCCGGRTSRRMMKAPGRGGNVFMPRSVFEANPSGYFQDLRGGYYVR